MHNVCTVEEQQALRNLFHTCSPLRTLHKQVSTSIPVPQQGKPQVRKIQWFLRPRTGLQTRNATALAFSLHCCFNYEQIFSLQILILVLSPYFLLLTLKIHHKRAAAPQEMTGEHSPGPAMGWVNRWLWKMVITIQAERHSLSLRLGPICLIPAAPAWLWGPKIWACPVEHTVTAVLLHTELPAVGPGAFHDCPCPAGNTAEPSLWDLLKLLFIISKSPVGKTTGHFLLNLFPG